MSVRYLLFLFVVVPFVELVLLVALGQLMGFWPTVLLIVVTGVSGAIIARREGLSALRHWQDALRAGDAPELALASGFLVLVGAVMLVTPGVLTDLAALACLLPRSRGWLARHLLARFSQSVSSGGSRVAFTWHSAGPAVMPRGFVRPAPARPRAGGVIEVDGEETSRRVR